MTLSARVSVFFLAALAVILLGNSLLIYAVARDYLHDRFQEQLHAALQTLVAAVEVEDDDVKWEPSDHTVTLGSGRDAEDLRWIVVNEQGRVIDQSRNFATTDRSAELLSAWLRVDSAATDSAGWRVLKQELAAPDPKSEAERSPLEHQRLTVLVARNEATLRQTLNRLALALIALPSICWLLAAIVGRKFCDRAIAPVHEMARDLQHLRADDTDARLRVPATGDELETLGNAFNALLDEIFLALERQRRFAGDAAHQLRTPLTVLQGQIDVALRRPRSAEDYQATLGVMRDEVRQLGRTVETLLHLARPAGEQPTPDTQTIDLAAWLEEYRRKWNTSDRSGDLHVSGEPGVMCRTSPDLLSQLLDVLVSNAINYSQLGTRIDVRGARQDGDSVIDVVDRGIGIAPEDQAAIFEPFFRTRQARHSGAPGTGLGLALAQRLAASLNARIVCDSQPGQGTCFRVSLSHMPRT